MRIRYKLFPYPVLCSDIDDYKNNKFDVQISVTRDIHNIKFNFEVNLEDLLIKEMIKNSKVEIVFHVECAKTLFRKIYKSNQLKNTIIIAENYLNGNIEICCFILAKENILSYYNPNFSEDYESTSFNISKGNILAFYNLPKVEITKDTEELSKVSSIFSILRRDSKKDEGMEVDLNEDKIKIWLSTEEFIKYQECAVSPVYQPILHATLILPSLIYALDMISIQGENEFNELRWFKAIDKILEKSNLSLNKDTIDNETSYKLAQKLLNLPINRAFEAMKMYEEVEA